MKEIEKYDVLEVQCDEDGLTGMNHMVLFKYPNADVIVHPVHP